MRLSTSAKTVGLTKFPLLEGACQRRRVHAAAQQRRAFLGAQLDVPAHLRQVIGADHGSDDGLLIERIADADAPRALGEFLRRSPRRSSCCTKMREPAVQRSPLLEKIMNTAASSARAKSASSKTTKGLLPPNSIENFFRPAALTMRFPVAVEPVKEIARTSGWRHSGSPASAP